MIITKTPFRMSFFGGGTDMENYFKELHKHAISKMEHISNHVITDEDSIDIALAHVAKYGTYHDFVKMLRYEMDANVAYHLLESTK
jgi:galactokinase/mevalonate kinase-like predicted kinase